MSRIVLGVSGGIAAYKACEVLRRLREDGHDVTVVPTENALRFVGETTFEALSGKPVATDVFTGASAIPHVRLGREADLVLVVPASADLIARQAAGRADDLLTNVLLTATCPCSSARRCTPRCGSTPRRGTTSRRCARAAIVVLDPASGRLAGADSGVGRLPEPAEIVGIAQSLLDATWPAARPGQDLAGLSVVVSAGGTHELIDPVRFIGNASSGRMGVEIARAAALRGARVTLVAAHLDVPPPPRWTSARSRRPATSRRRWSEAARDADIVVMAAAPADFTPCDPSATKLKKSGEDGLTLTSPRPPTSSPDSAGTRREGQTIVGFAAETIPDEAALVRGRPREARAQERRPARRQRRVGPQGVRDAGQYCLDRGRRRCPGSRRGQQGRRRTSDTRRGDEPPRHQLGSASVSSVHVGVRHRGPPRQGRRLDLGRGARRPARPGPQEPGRRRDPRHHRTGRGGRER
jgi:phosphopantothenoylcysteine decarboxylase/phosphopantothenate--cysteine ligase